MGVQGLNGKIAALDACQVSFDVFHHICFHPGPMYTHSGQGQCLVDSYMAFVEIIHDTVSVGQWELPLVHPSGAAGLQWRACLGNPSKIWWLWGHVNVFLANHSESICGLLTGLGLIVSLSLTLVRQLLVKADMDMASTLRLSLISVLVLEGR